MHVSRSLLVALLAAAAAPSTAVGEPPAPAPVAPPATPAAKVREMTPRERAEAIALLHDYLEDENADRTRHRLYLKVALAAWKKAGYDLLADSPTLLDLLYNARPFVPGPYEKRGLPKDAEFQRDEAARLTSIEFAGPPGQPGQRFSYSLPMGYPDAKKINQVPPYPTVLVLHNLADFQEGAKSKKFPGAEAIRRLYPRSGPSKAVTDEHLVFAPVASRAVFSGNVPQRVIAPFADFWKRYHVDFDRVVLDGSDDVLSIAAGNVVFFCGVVVRGDKADVDPLLVRNFANLPVYVAGGDKVPAVKTLRDGGVQVTVGSAEGVGAWLKALKPRVVPTDFRWHVKDPKAHVLAHWVNINVATAGGEMRVRADREANVVEILDAKGITDVGLFLNDRVVDLSRPVKIVLNGKDAGPPKVYDRNLDVMFEGDRVKIRASRYYGWLYPASIERLEVPEPPAAPTPSAPGADAAPVTAVDDENEAEAARYFQKGEEAEKGGDLARALALFRKAVAVGESSFKARAEGKVKTLEGKEGKEGKPAEPAKSGASGK